MDGTSRLDLETLFADLPFLTQWLAEQYYSALVVCLEYLRHEPGIQVEVRNLLESLADLKIQWSKPISEDDFRSWGEPRNAVEYAAEGIAWLIIRKFTDYTVMERSHIGDGVDFWLGTNADAKKRIFQRRARMEVKGRLRLTYDSQLRQVLREALRQTDRSDYTELPAFIVLVEFSRPLIYLVRK